MVVPVKLSNLPAPREGVQHEEQNTTAYIRDKEVGKGTLYITESSLLWVNSETQEGFELLYPDISLHAISRDQQVHARQCLYLNVEKVDLPDVPSPPSSNDSLDSEQDDADLPTIEMRFAPDNINNLEAMFQAMSQCQKLHPDPEDNFSDDGEIYEDAEGEDESGHYEVGAGDAPHILSAEQLGANHNGTELQEAMDIEAGQFEDAEEDPRA